MRIYINILKLFTFIIIFCLLWSNIFDRLWVRENPITKFYDEEENTLDVIYIGPSNVYLHFNPVLAYNLHGFTTGILSTDASPFIATKYLIKEASKTQKPVLYVVDLATMPIDFTSYKDGDFRKTIDSMKLSKNRSDLIDNFVEYKNSYNFEINSKSDYYFSYLIYHNRWKEITKDNYEKNNYYYKGYFFSPYTTKIEKHQQYNWITDKEELPKNNIKVLLELLEYIKLNDINVIFTIPVKVYSANINKRLNTAIDIINSYGYEVVNFNNEKELNINFDKDLYISSHLNVYGATKNTIYFSKYLKNNYELPDHRKDKKYNSWKEEFNRFIKDFKKITNKNFDELLISMEENHA